MNDCEFLVFRKRGIFVYFVIIFVWGVVYIVCYKVWIKEVYLVNNGICSNLLLVGD